MLSGFPKGCLNTKVTTGPQPRAVTSVKHAEHSQSNPHAKTQFAEFAGLATQHTQQGSGELADSTAAPPCGTVRG